MQKPGRRTFAVLDAMRGVAALFVMLRHSTFFVGHMPFHQSYLAVDLFFLLSGIVLCQAYEARLVSAEPRQRAGFLYLRAVRIYPLYALGLIIAVAAALIGPDAARSDLAVLATLAVFLLPNLVTSHMDAYPLNGPSWSLFFELAVNAAYALAIRRLSDALLWAVVAASGLALAGCVLLLQNHSLDVGWTQQTFAAGFPRVAFSFFLGVLLYRRFTRVGPFQVGPRWQTAATAGTVAIVALALMNRPPPSLRPLADLATVVLVFPAVVYAALSIQPAGFVARICKELGVISYAIYAIHQPLARLLESLLGRVGVTSLDGHRLLAASLFTVLLLSLCRWLDGNVDAPLRKALLAASTRWGSRSVARTVSPNR